MVKPIAMVRPLKRENSENFSKDSPCKKFKASEDAFKHDDELSKYAKEVNKPEVGRVDSKTTIPSLHQTAKAADFNDESTSQPKTPKTETALPADISEKQCGDCHKIMKSMKSLIDHKKKFRCPGKKIGPIQETDENFKGRKILSEEPKLEDAAIEEEIITLQHMTTKEVKEDDIMHALESSTKTPKLGIISTESSYETKTEARQLSCSGCKYEFSHAKTLRKHIRGGTCKNSGINFAIKSYRKNTFNGFIKKNNTLDKGKSPDEASSSLIESGIIPLHELICRKCDRQFVYGSNLRKHVRKDLCSKYQKEEILTTQELNSGKCSTCDKRFNQKHNLRKHVERAICVKYKSKTRKIEYFTCEKCDRKFSQKGNLKRHVEKAFCSQKMKQEILNTHEIESLFCGKCDKKFEQNINFKMHIEKDLCSKPNKKEILSEYELESGRCGKCDKKFNQKYNLRIHTKRASCSKNSEGKNSITNGLMSAKCGKCEKQYSDKWGLKRHIDRDLCGKDCILSPNELETGKCDGCEKHFSKKCNLRYHIESTPCKSENLSAIELDSGNCDACGKHFTDIGSMRIHKRKSNCSNFEQKGIDKLGILTPMEFSSGECDTCGRSFTDVSNLRRHKTKLACQKDWKRSNLAANLTGSSFTNKTQTKDVESILGADRSSPSVAMLTSAIDQLMTNLGKEKPEATKGDQKKKKRNKGAAKVTLEEKEKAETNEKKLEEKTDLLVCGVILTPTGKISVVRPRNAIVQKGSDLKQGMVNNTFAESGSDLKLGMAKLKFLAPRLFKGKLTLATVIAATRLPASLVINWMNSLVFTLPPE